MSRPTVPALACLCIVGIVCASLAGVALALADFETLPPEPGETGKKVSAMKVRLVAAIQTAERETGGLAGSASLVGTAYEIVVYAGGNALSVKVDGNTGTIASKTEMPRFPGEAVQGDMKKTKSGLGYYDVKVGDGKTPAGPSSKVKVHYTGWLVDGKKFDSSRDRQPITFPLSGVISGWTEGVGSMKVGGRRKLIIPYALAYGERGRGSIPPKATLIFDVELLEVTD